RGRRGVLRRFWEKLCSSCEVKQGTTKSEHLFCSFSCHFPSCFSPISMRSSGGKWGLGGNSVWGKLCMSLFALAFPFLTSYSRNRGAKSAKEIWLLPEIRPSWLGSSSTRVFK